MNKKKNDSELRRLLESRDMGNNKTKERLIGAGYAIFGVFITGSVLASTIFVINKSNKDELKNQEPIEKEADEPSSSYSEEDIQKIVDETLKEYEKLEEIEEPEKETEEETNTYKKVDVKSYKGNNSIISLLKEMDLPTDKKFRTQLALLYGIENYTGTAEQNIALFNAIMEHGLIIIVDDNGNIIGFKTEDDSRDPIELDEEAQKIVNECMKNKDNPKGTGSGSKGHKTEIQPSGTQNQGTGTTGTTQPTQPQPTTPITQPSGTQNQGTVDITQPESSQPTVPTGGNEGNSSGDDNDYEYTTGGSTGGGNTGGGNTGGGNTGGGNTGGGNTGGDNTGGGNTGGDNTGGGNTGGGNTGGDNTGGDNTGGDNTGGDVDDEKKEEGDNNKGDLDPDVGGIEEIDNNKKEEGNNNKGDLDPDVGGVEEIVKSNTSLIDIDYYEYLKYILENERDCLLSQKYNNLILTKDDNRLI